MAALDREAIFVALFDRLKAVDGFVTFARTLAGADTLEAVEQPALILTKGNESPTRRRGLPTTWRLEATVWILARVRESDPEQPPSVVLNELLTGVEQALYRTPLEGPATDETFLQNPDKMIGTTLGGLCYSCAIDGEIAVSEGTNGLEAFAEVPVIIYTSST